MLSNIQQAIFKKEQWPNELVLFDINSGININNPFGITDWSKTQQSGSANVTNNGYYIQADRIGTNQSWANITNTFNAAINFDIYKQIKVEYNYCYCNIASGYNATATSSISFGGYTINQYTVNQSGGSGTNVYNNPKSWTSTLGQFSGDNNLQLFVSIRKRNSLNANCYAIVQITKVTMLK